MRKLVDSVLVLVLVGALGYMVFLNRNDGWLVVTPSPTASATATSMITPTTTSTSTATAVRTNTPRPRPTASSTRPPVFTATPLSVPLFTSTPMPSQAPSEIAPSPTPLAFVTQMAGLDFPFAAGTTR